MENSAPAQGDPIPTAATHSSSPMGGATDDHDGWAALDAVAFDSSLSFLAEADAKPVPSQVLLGSPTTVQPSDDDDAVASELANDVLALATDEDPESEPVETSSPGGSETSASPAPPAPPTPEKPTKRAYASSRVRQKQEIAYLRAQVAELESELAAKSLQVAAATGTEAPSAWKHIAQRQLGEKMRAERENAALCSLLEGQLRVARSLERLLRKRVLSETDALFVDRKRQRGGVARLDLEMAVNEIHERISHQFATVHAIMVESGLAGITTDHDDARAVNDATNGICMELMTVKVYPFSLKDVADAVWACACAGGDDSRADLEFTVPLHVRRSQAQVHIRGVCERRVDAKEALIVFENVGVVEGALVAGQEINCREFGYMIVEEGVASGDTPSTILKACARMWPEADAGLDSQESPEVGLFVDLVLGFYNQHTQAILQTVENMLLSRSLGKASE